MQNINQPGVYSITNKTTFSRYVGSAVNLASRWAAHRHSLRHHKKSPPKLQRAWDKYGEESFEFHVLEFCPREQTLVREQAWIDALNPRYNTRKQAASNLGVVWSAETNAKKGRPTSVHTVQGVTGGIRQLAKHFGVVTHETAHARVLRGYSVERAVTEPPVPTSERGRRGAKTHKANGTHPSAKLRPIQGEMLSLKTAIDKFGKVSYTTARARIRRGWGFEAAVVTPFVEYSERVRPQK